MSELRSMRWPDRGRNTDDEEVYHRQSAPLLYQYYSPVARKNALRQRCCQTTTCLVLIVAYVAIILGALASFSLLTVAQNKYVRPHEGRECVLGDRGIACTLVRVLDFCVVFCASLLVVVALVKAGCGVW